MAERVVFMYSGQGSQYFHMGEDFQQSNHVFRNHLLNLDEQVRARAGTSILKALYDPANSKATPLTDVTLSSLSIFMIEYAMTQVLLEQGCRPDLLLSVSMGAYAAMSCSGVASSEVLIDALHSIAQALSDRCPAGSMLAVLASPELHERSAILTAHSEIASITSPSHFVLSVADSGLEQVTRELREHAAACQHLPVSRAYHSRWIDPVEEDYLGTFATLPMAAASIPLQTCCGEGELTRLSAEGIWASARGQMYFREAILDLEATGPNIYIDVGPSGTLATLLKYILANTSRSRVYSVLTPFAEASMAFDRLFTEPALR